MVVGVLMPTHDNLHEGWWQFHVLHTFQESMSGHGIKCSRKVECDLQAANQGRSRLPLKSVVQSTVMGAALGTYVRAVIEHPA